MKPEISFGRLLQGRLPDGLSMFIHEMTFNDDSDNMVHQFETRAEAKEV